MAHTDTLTNMIDNIHVDVCLSDTALSTLHLTSSCVYISGRLLCMTNTNNMLRKSGTISSNASATAIEWWLHTMRKPGCNHRCLHMRLVMAQERALAKVSSDKHCQLSVYHCSMLIYQCPSEVHTSPEQAALGD
jgi:hypothetical protein